jgi:hypothetical protein
MRTVLHSLKIYRGYARNMAQMYLRTKSYYHTQIVKKGWVGLMSYTRNQIRDRELKEIGEFIIHQKSPGIKLNVFIALSKFTQKSKSNKKAVFHQNLKLIGKVIFSLR